jgi:hypothetical protein
MPAAAPAAPSAPAPAGGGLINTRDAAYAGVDFNKLNSGDTVNGQKFVHNGQGWTVAQAGAAPAGAAPSGGSADFPSLPPGATPPPGYVDPVSGKTAPTSPAAAPAAPGTPAAPAPAAGAPAAGVPAAPPATISDAFKQSLITKLSGAQPIDTNNAAIAPAIQANKLAEQRGFENNRNILAERAAKSGTDASGGFDTDLIGLGEDRAMREGKYAGDAVMHLQDQQNDDIMRALGIGGGAYEGEQNRAFQGGENQKGRDLQTIMQDKSLSMQDKIAQIDAALRGKGIDQSGRLGEGQLNLGLLSLLTGADYNNRALDQQGAQFGAGLDAQTIMGLLGGLG